MKKLGIFVLMFFMYGCGAPDPLKSKECIQAKNKVTIYTDSLENLKGLYSDDINSSEAKRRISAMRDRIGLAHNSVNIQCKRN